MDRDWHRKGAAALVFFIVTGAFALGALAQEGAPLRFSGKGNYTSEPFPITEGALVFHIATQTACTICGVWVSLEEDNDLDGRFVSGGDNSLIWVWQAGYEDIQNAQVTVEHEVMGGQARLRVEASESTQWEVEIEQKPYPRHELEVSVVDENTQDYIFNAVVTVTDENGEKTETRQNTTYGYFHYYFDRKFYGYRAYTLKAEAPGYEPATASITLEDWKALESPYWPLRKKLSLKKKGCEPVQLPVSSFFDAGSEGWQVTGDAQGGSSEPSWRDGFVTATDDAAGGVWYWKAPEKFLGDLSAAYGEVLAFSLKQSATDKPFEDSDVILDTEKGRLVHTLPHPPGTSFTSYEVPFRGSAWKKDGAAVSDEALKEALACVKALLIRGEFREGPDEGALDNVRIGPAASAQIPCTVKDRNTQKPIAGARVTAVDASGRFRAAAVTGPDGWCTLSGIPEGDYQVTASAQGYEKKTLPGIALSSGTVLPVHFELAATGKKADVYPLIQGPPVNDANLGRSVRLEVIARNRGPSATKAALKIRVNKPHRFLHSYDPGNPNVDAFGTLNGLTATSPKGTCTFSDDNAAVDCELKEIAPRSETKVTLYLLGMKAETAVVTASVEATSEEVLEVNPQDNRKTFSFPFLAVPFRGRVYAVNKHNRRLPLARAVLEITSVSASGESTTSTTYTDLKGFFEGEPVREIGEKASLTVYLKDKDGVITVRDYNAFNGKVVSFETREVELTPDKVGTAFRFVEFSSASPLASQTAKALGTLLRSAANLYAEAYRAMRFGKEELAMRYDHQLPVDIFIAHPTVGCAACYDPRTSTIYFKRSDAEYTHPDNPDNGAIHEFGHHVNADSLLGGRNTYARTGKNHAGVFNEDSSDSLVEGFAEFFSAMVRNNPIYHMAGGNLNLEQNMTWTRYKKKWIPYEEANVASLLWDLADTAKDRGDNLAYGFKGTWAWLNNEKVKNVWTLYSENRKGTPDTMDFNRNGVQDVDELFIAHNFFYDADEDKKYDAGEEVGYAGFWPVKGWFYTSTYRREKMPTTPGSALKVSLSQKPYPVTWYRVRARYAGGRVDAYATTATPEGLLYLPLAPGLEEVSVAPELSGYTADAWSVDGNALVEQVDQAQDANHAFFAEHRFEVKASGVPAPQNLAASQDGASSVSLLWQSQLAVRVVRARAGPPQRPAEGETVYEGSAQAWSDENVKPGEQYFYSVFAEKDGSLSQPATVRVYVDEAWERKKLLLQAAPRPREEAGEGRGKEAAPAAGGEKEAGTGEGNALAALVLFLALVAAAGFFLYREKKRGEKESHGQAVAYFAYGANMDRENLEKRGVRVFSAEAAFARGWKRVFNKKASAGGGEGFANLVREKGALAHGVLYRVPAEDLKKLDEYEGAPAHYTRQTLAVTLQKDGKTTVKAQAYFAAKGRTADGLKPSKAYLDLLVRGARSHGLPASVVKELSQTPALGEGKQGKQRRTS